MILTLLATASAQTRPEQAVRPPISEVEHPRYVDAAGAPLTWRDVRALSADSDAIGRVRRRQIGRNVMRVAFAGVAAAEVWGTVRLAEQDSWVALPLGIQAAATSLCAVLSWTNMPSARVEDHAIVLAGANHMLQHRR